MTSRHLGKASSAPRLGEARVIEACKMAAFAVDLKAAAREALPDRSHVPAIKTRDDEDAAAMRAVQQVLRAQSERVF